jgi:hypothetical protein
MAAQLRVVLAGMQRRVTDMQTFLDGADNMDEPMQLSVQLPPPHMPLSIEVLGSDNVAFVKGLIARQARIPPDHQLLTYNGVRLTPPWRMLREFLILPESTLVMLPQRQIYVLMRGGKIITVEVAGWDTVASVKAEIEIKEHVPMEAQRLIFEGDELLNEQTLDMCNVFRYSKIHLRIIGEAPNRIA